MYRILRAGWFTKEKETKKKKIQQGDYVFYFENDSAEAVVSRIGFDEKLSENRMLDFFTEFHGKKKNSVQQISKPKGFDKLMNDPPTDVDRYDHDQNPGIYLTKYNFTVRVSKMKKFFLSNNLLIHDIVKEQEDAEYFKFKPDRQTYQELMKSNEKTKTQFMKKLMNEIVEILFIHADWDKFESQELQDLSLIHI